MAGRDVKRATSFHTHNMVLPTGALKSAPRVKAQAGLSNVPRPHGFVGRDRQLDALDTAFATSGEVVVQALHGLGGVGKSTLAAYWARTRSRSSPQWWITAESPATLDAGLADFAVALHPVLTSMEMGADDLRGWALSWLATHRNWLIVLDNVDDPQHVRPVIERAGHGGRFLITSRRATGWHQLSSTVPLDVLEEAEAVELFTGILTHEKQRDSTGAAEVCAEVGFLPLAVEQAASYCAETGVSPRAYLDLLTSKPAEMFATTAEGGDVDRTIARIWSITLDRLKDTPLAGEVLRALAWYAPDGIPRNLLDDLAYPSLIRKPAAQLRSQAAKEVTGRRLRLLKLARSHMEQLADPQALNTAIGRLAAYNMISEQDGIITVHRLVQALARTPDPKDHHRRAKDITSAQQVAANALYSRLPVDADDPGAWPTWHALLPHVIAHTDHTPPESETAATARLLAKASQFHLEQGALARGTAAGSRAAQIHERLLGKRHRTTLTSGTNLAAVYQAAGDLRRAIPLSESVLADSERILGTDHPDTLTRRNNLATAYLDAGDLRRAIPLSESVLADSERILGTDHPNTLTRRNNLASVYQAAGDLKRAIPLLESNLADSERILGTDHPDTLTSRNNLASVYQAAGDLKRVIPLLESVLADSERILGTDHPDTLTRRGNLASVYQAAGDLKRAIALFESVLADSERILGTDHPNTLISRNNLASVYQAAGDLKRAIPLLESNLADSERILGTDHPNTLIYCNNLATAYQGAKNLKQAIALFESNLADSERILGTDHPDTLTRRSNLGRAYQDAKRLHGPLG
ncbi:FxSxx-COOH system tetratricopeptide repeat protein [Streptomyces olivochromogenes]|uniref:FxSxx-COOH system tetratricopeptide repeat protein n=1 Tax=Streptomyces olivochromogenes TaxID=1963 RepID=UPI001F25A773|nr:FxSxx-COOH system tetratricopeptide repeat protein [Streptomyces olivochromogenes]MCF3130229.1 ATP-binding protein [Streptomyces olivochromogenes]